jgi:hypothetical protein
MSTLDESLPRGTPRLLRAINERALLESLRQDGAASRADLARASGLSNRRRASSSGSTSGTTGSASRPPTCPARP